MCYRSLITALTSFMLLASAMVKVVRVSIDQRALNYWNEIDAVKLIGDH